jgi:hypothetical protein
VRMHSVSARAARSMWPHPERTFHRKPFTRMSLKPLTTCTAVADRSTNVLIKFIIDIGVESKARVAAASQLLLEVGGGDGGRRGEALYPPQNCYQ